MIFHKVGILLNVDGLERQLAESLSSVSIGVGGRSDATAAGFTAGAVLEIHPLFLQGRAAQLMLIYKNVTWKHALRIKINYNWYQ